MRGRKPVGPRAVAQAAGSAQAKERAEVILATLAGTCRMEEACRRLGVGKTRFHQLRQELLQAAVASQEPKPVGRPRAEPAPQAAAVAALEQRVVELEVAARTAQVREEIALILPRVGRTEAGPEAAAEKKSRRRPRRRSRRGT
jgi:hypothetical protein